MVRNLLESSSQLMESLGGVGKQAWVLHSHKQHLEEGQQDRPGQDPSAAPSSYWVPLTLGTRTSPEEGNASTLVPCKGTHSARPPLPRFTPSSTSHANTSARQNHHIWTTTYKRVQEMLISASHPVLYWKAHKKGQAVHWIWQEIAFGTSCQP